MSTPNLVDLMGLTNAELDVIQTAIREGTLRYLEVFVCAPMNTETGTQDRPALLFKGVTIQEGFWFSADLRLPTTLPIDVVTAARRHASEAITVALEKAIDSCETVAGRYSAKVMRFAGTGSYTHDPERAELGRAMALKLRVLLAKFTEARGS